MEKKAEYIKISLNAINKIINYVTRKEKDEPIAQFPKKNFKKK